MKLITSKNYSREVFKLFKNKKRLDIAVAFLGVDALELFKSSPHKKIRVVCNFESGACNPALIRKLKLDKYSHVEIRSQSSLHAKLLVQDKKVILGSANLSANGLSLEGAEQTAWHELGVLLKNKSTISDAKSWFEKEWCSSNTITEADIVYQEVNWQKRRQSRPQKASKKSLLETALESIEPIKDRNIYFTLCTDDVSEEAEEALEKIKPKYSGFEGLIDFYEDWPELPDDAYLINLELEKNGQVTVSDDIYKTPQKAMIHKFSMKNDDENQIKLCFKEEDIQGYRFTKNDRTMLKDNFDLFKNHPEYDPESALLFSLEDWSLAMKKLKV